jgi:hypothetical protein
LYFAKIRNIKLRRNVLKNIKGFHFKGFEKGFVPIIRKVLNDKGVIIGLREERTKKGLKKF